MPTRTSSPGLWLVLKCAARCLLDPSAHRVEMLPFFIQRLTELGGHILLAHVVCELDQQFPAVVVREFGNEDCVQ